MKDKGCAYTPVLLIVVALRFAIASESPNEIKGVLQKYNHGLKLERIVAAWNKSSENLFENVFEKQNSGSVENFATEIKKCIKEYQYQITKNITQGKAIIFDCFKTTLIINILKHMGESRKSTIKLLNGLLEFEKVPEDCEEVKENSVEGGSCTNRQGRRLGAIKRSEYVRMYKNAMMKLIRERSRLNAFRNQTADEREKLLDRINENSQAFLSEVIRNIGDEEAEKTEEDKIRKEVADPKLWGLLDEVSKSYMLKLRFYPGVAARMMRSRNGGFTFDLEVDDPAEDDDGEGEAFSEEQSTREIKDGPQSKDYDDEDDDDSNGNKRKKSKGDKKKKKEKKKKAKKLKKIVPYLLIPILIQMTLLPFVFKKLFFLAMKALFAGKMALILVGFNLLRNTCIKNDDDFQKIRVEHYGYRRGEEYGAWVNGRSLQESLILSALNEGSFTGENQVTF